MVALPESNWKITDELVKEFDELKEYLESHIQLSPIRVGEPLQLYTDASIEGLSFLLCQEHKITFVSLKLTIKGLTQHIHYISKILCQKTLVFRYESSYSGQNKLC